MIEKLMVTMILLCSFVLVAGVAVFLIGMTLLAHPAFAFIAIPITGLALAFGAFAIKTIKEECSR